MLNGEHKGSQEAKHRATRLRLLTRRQLASCATTLTLVSTACAPDSQPSPPPESLATTVATAERLLPDRAAPDSGNYLVDPNDKFHTDVTTLMSAVDDDTRERLATLEDRPVAVWLSNDHAKMLEQIKQAVLESEQQNSVPTFVHYHVPERDLGGESGGGAASEEEFLDSIQHMSDAIGENNSIVVIEPDALAHTRELPENDQEKRLDMLADSLKILQQNSNTAVYLDAGNATWLAPEELSSLLQEIDMRSGGKLHGIALNISNYLPTKETEEYARRVMDEFGRQLYVLTDASRNGGAVGEQGEFCNIPGAKIGDVDNHFNSKAPSEEMWIKVPGESDGVCGESDQPAGVFDGELLIGLMPDAVEQNG